MAKSNSTKYLYAVIDIKIWGASSPTTYRTKKDLVSHFGLKNTRIVEKWFENSWIYMGYNNYIVTRMPIPKMKSKIRK